MPEPAPAWEQVYGEIIAHMMEMERKLEELEWTLDKLIEMRAKKLESQEP